jgi:hypothetical protein
MTDPTPQEAAALEELAAAGIGEGDFDGDHAVPSDLVVLYEVLEWENAVAFEQSMASDDDDMAELPHPEIGLHLGKDPGVERSTPFVSRAGWGARAPKSVTRRDLTRNTAHYGGPSPWPSTADRSSPARFAATTDHARCPTICRAYQAFHMDTRGWQDIAYSSLVCPHRTRYEGRGKDVRTAANGTTAGNNASHATCFIAGEGDPLPDGTKEAYLDESARLDGLDAVHSDWKSTACPGEPVRRWVKAGKPAPTPPPPEDDFDMDKATFKAWVAEALDDQAVITGIAGGPRPWYGKAFEWIYKGARDAIATRTIVTSIARKVDALGDVDEAEVAQLVLQGLDPTAIAAAIPDDIAERVVSELHDRLAPTG